jgi:hypothetical protein
LCDIFQEKREKRSGKMSSAFKVRRMNLIKKKKKDF